MKTKKTTCVVFLYALTVLVGGLIGHFRSGSKASLISGTIFGVLLCIASWLMYQKKPSGIWMALTLSIVLEVFFTWRFAKSLHFLPSGLLSLLSLIVIILVALKAVKRVQSLR